MDATKNKKYLPAIIAVAAVALIGAVAAVLINLHLLGGAPAAGPETASRPPAASPSPFPHPATPQVSITETTPDEKSAPTKEPTAKKKAAAAKKAAKSKKILSTVANPHGVSGAGAPGTADTAQVAVAPTVPATPPVPGTVPPIDPHAVPDPFGGVTPAQAKAKHRKPVLLAQAPTGVLNEIHQGLLYHEVLIHPVASPDSVSGDSVGALPGAGGFGGGDAGGGYNPSGGGGATGSLPRVSGILYDNGVYAILQMPNGDSQTVKPNDDVPGVGKVVSIQSDSVTIHTNDGRTISLPLASGGG